MKLLKVARWEFKKTTKSKGFLVMTVFIPAMIALAVFGVAVGLGVDKEAIRGNPPRRSFWLSGWPFSYSSVHSSRRSWRSTA